MAVVMLGPLINPNSLLLFIQLWLWKSQWSISHQGVLYYKLLYNSIWRHSIVGASSSVLICCWRNVLFAKMNQSFFNFSHQVWWSWKYYSSRFIAIQLVSYYSKEERGVLVTRLLVQYKQRAHPKEALRGNSESSKGVANCEKGEFPSHSRSISNPQWFVGLLFR